MSGSLTAQVVTRTRGLHGTYTETPGPTFRRCSLQPVSSKEQLDGGEITTSRWNFTAPPDFPTASANLVLVAGLRLHAEGDLQLVIDRTGRPRRVVGVLTKWEG